MFIHKKPLICVIQKGEIFCLFNTEIISNESSTIFKITLFSMKKGRFSNAHFIYFYTNNYTRHLPFCTVEVVSLAAKQLLHTKSWKIHLRGVPTAHTLMPRFVEGKHSCASN